MVLIKLQARRAHAHHRSEGGSVKIENGRIAVQSEGTRASDLHVHELPTMPVGAVENDDLVVAGAAHHAGGILLARTLDEDLHGLTEIAAVTLGRDLID